jgi:tmRNA-binding protein
MLSINEIARWRVCVPQSDRRLQKDESQNVMIREELEIIDIDIIQIIELNCYNSMSEDRIQKLLCQNKRKNKICHVCTKRDGTVVTLVAETGQKLKP